MIHSSILVLVVDDDLDVRLLIERGLRGLPSVVVTQSVSSGNEAIAYLTGDGQYSDRSLFPYPNIILTDLNMPGGDGFTLLEHLKSNPVLAVIPTIVFSSSEDADDVRTAYALGASAYHVKPPAYDELVGLLRLIHSYWMSCQIPVIDLSGKQVRPITANRASPRRSQDSPADSIRVRCE